MDKVLLIVTSEDIMKEERTGLDWGTVSDRVAWLLEHRFSGRRSQMAKATGVSLGGIIKVVTGQQTPGRRLLEAIVANTDVSPAWLLTGEGQPYRAAAMPVATECLASPPVEMTDAVGVPDLSALYASTRYWLRLGRSQPAVKASGTGLRAGDLLLVETDRPSFPPPEQLDGRWGVVRVSGREGSVLRLAELTFNSATDDHSAYVEADTFLHHPQMVRRFTLDEWPDGTVEVSKRRVMLEQSPRQDGGKAGRGRWKSSILPLAVAPEDVVAVCVLLVRGYASVSKGG